MYTEMADIKAILNPMSERRSAVPFTPNRNTAAMRYPNSPRKKTKLTKDAAVFQHGPIRGECRFPPDEYEDEVLAAYHQQFEVSPFGEIADYPRHIPYNSEKKGFQERTGRESLEVFQYTFKMSGDDTEYVMLWDYNIGLVRTTPLFKCTGHSKTTPAKMLNKNPGLKEICHSITGGALVAQGYWIPHAAAKAIAATFCYDIRYALTPVFGRDFPQMCIKPNAEGYGDMTIDPKITQHCREEARRFREEEKHATPHILTPNLSSRTSSPSVQRARGVQARLVDSPRSPYDSPELGPSEPDICSDDDYTLAPSTSPTFRNPWSAVNTFRTPPRSVPHLERHLPSPRSIMNRYGESPKVMTDFPLTPPRTATSRNPSVEVSPTAMPSHQMSALRTTCEDDACSAANYDVHDDLNCAISLLCSATGLSRAELVQRLEISNEMQQIDQKLDAAITMVSLRTSLSWKEVAGRLKLSWDEHKRSASWSG